MEKPSKKSLIVILSVVGLLASFLLSQSFRDTLSRKKALHEAMNEAQILDQKIESLENQLTRLKNNPTEYELLVRQELGYLKPGEKEIRFQKE